MKHLAACLIAGMTLGSAALAATPSYLTVDHSSDALMDAGTAKAMWERATPAALVKLYPPKRWGFVSEVTGGFTASKTCVVTARAMMAPVSGKSLLFKPSHGAVTFDALPNATQEQCKELGKAKLKEAIDGVFAGTVAGK
jgi:hypothetical protein